MTGSALTRLTPAQRAELAARLRRHREDDWTTHPAGSHPLSVTQHRMWLAEVSGQADPAAFTVPLALRLTGKLDTGRLRSCLQLLGERHLALQATIAEECGVPRQSFGSWADVPMEIRRLDSETMLEEALRQEAARPIRLTDPQYIRALVLRTGAEEHALLLTLHHAVCDGWSLGILIEELLRSYAVPGEPRLPDPAPAAQHLDYVAWELSADGKAYLDACGAYWATRNGAMPDVPDLPFGRAAYGLSCTSVSPSVQLTLPDGMLAAVRGFARSHGATELAVWLAAFAVSWHLATGAQAVPVGVPAANRSEERYDRTVGPFATAIPAVIPVPPDASFAQVVATTTGILLEGAEHAVVPLGHAYPAGSPTAVMFVLIRENGQPRSSGPLTAELLPARVPGSQGDLTMQLVERDGRMAGSLTGSCTVYTIEGLTRLAGMYRRCLETMVRDPGKRLDAMDARDPGEVAVLKSCSAGASARACPPPHEAFAQTAQRSPKAFAAWDPIQGQVTYGELAARSASVSSALRSAGVRGGSVVALRVPPGSTYLALALATWRLGGCIVPLRRDDPPSRLRDLLATMDGVFLVQDDDGPMAALPPVTALRLADIVTHPPGARPRPARVHAGDLAYAVFTSGSTGTPKCVTVSHGALANQLSWRCRVIGLTASDRVLQTISLAFDPSFWQCFGPLTVGAGVVFADPAEVASPAGLVDAAIAHGATVIDVVPSQLAALSDEDVRRLSARVVFCGGEALPAAEAQRYLRVSQGKLFNQYGPSETCIDATSHRCLPGGVGDGTVPIGRPITGVRVHVLDSVLRPVPPGAVGELYIAGSGLARGYAGQAAETAARFLPEPGGIPGARMYRTGDRACWNANGTLQFLGRTDTQVKIRGHRVELQEIDRCLTAVPGVRMACTAVAGRLASRTAAFVSGAPGLDQGEIRGHLARMLPRYMIPAEIRVLTALPLSANGKADRRKLAELADSGRDRQAKPGTGAEDPALAAVLDAFTTVLELPAALASDDLYELGGASLGAARIAAMVSRKLDIDISVRAVLAHPQAADLARFVAEHRGRRDGATPGAVTTAGPLTPEQCHVRQLEQALGAPAPAVPLLIRLYRHVGLTELRHAVRTLADRHDALRPLPGARAARNWEPCSRAPLPAEPGLVYWQPGTAERFMPDEFPGIHATLLSSPGGIARHVLVQAARNRADGTSVAILAAELARLLAGVQLPSTVPRYADYARARLERADARRGELEQFWRDCLRDVPKDLGAKARRTRRDFRNIGVQALLPAAEYEHLARSCRKTGITTTPLLLATVGQLVTRIAGTRAAVVGMPVGHRAAGGEQGLVGRAVDLLPVVVCRGEDPAVTHRTLLGALDHADLPLLRIAELADPVHPAERPAVCGAALIKHNRHDPDPATPAVMVSDILPGDRVPEHWSDLDLVCHVTPTAGRGCHILLSGARQIFGHDDLDALLASFREYLSSWPGLALPDRGERPVY
ncbi:MAG TPA: amino acid adenylation domain-containing protein [Streptosporangiaceae bacterium]